MVSLVHGVGQNVGTTTAKRGRCCGDKAPTPATYDHFFASADKYPATITRACGCFYRYNSQFSHNCDAANRLTQVSSQGYTQTYTFDDNGNLLRTGVLTNVFDAANRLTSTTHAETTPVLPKYNGVGDRVAQTVGGTTVYYALDVVGLPEVIQTSEGNSYLHLPGVVMAESAEGEVRYLLSDGLGSIRQAVDETEAVVSSDEYDPYGNPLTQHASRLTPYAYTGEWWEQDVGLLHLRARWYLPETGTFLSRDPVEGELPYLYVRGNPVKFTDPSGMCVEFGDDACWGVYEQIVQLCPECATLTRPTLTGDRLLHQENIWYLQTVLERVRAGWRPSFGDQLDWVHTIESIFESLARAQPTIFRRASSGTLPASVPVSAFWNGVASASTICGLVSDISVTSISAVGAMIEGVVAVVGTGASKNPIAGGAAGMVSYEVFDAFENAGSTVGACCTVAGEWAGGQGLFVDKGEFVIGQDTLIVASTLAVGNIDMQIGPVKIGLEGVGDTIVNAIQLWYDANRAGRNVPTFVQGRAKMLSGPVPLPEFWPFGINSYISVFDVDAQSGWWQQN